MNKRIVIILLCCCGAVIAQLKPVAKDDSLLSSSKKQWIDPQTKPTQKAKALQRIVISYFQNQSSADSLAFYNDLYLRYTLQHKLNTFVVDAYFQKVNAERGRGDWIALIKTGQEALHKIDSLKISVSAHQKSLIIDEMVYGYIFLSDIENAVSYTQQSIEALQKENHNGANNLQISMMYLTTARAFGYTNDYLTSSRYLDSSLVYINQTSDVLQKHYILNDWVSIKIDLKKYAEALPTAYQCLRFFEKNTNIRGLTEIQMLMGRLFLGLRKYDEAIAFSKKSIEKITNTRILYRSYETLYYAYKAKNQLAEALTAHEHYIEFKDKLFNEQVANAKVALERRFAEEKATVLLNKEKAEVAIQKRYRNYFIAGAILLAIVSAVLFFNRRLLQKQNQEIEYQRDTIEKLNVNLEAKVQSRTAELQKAYDEIKDAMQRGQNLERRRMAADLHDNLGSLLTAISISLDNINPQHLNHREKKIYTNIISMTENAYSEIRLLSHNLMPEVLEREGLPQALEQFARKLNLNQKIHFSVKINALPTLSNVVSLNVYAICLELVQNIIKHSKATESTICIFENGTILWVEVTDNGKGLPNNQHKGFGIGNIQTRLETIGGDFLIDKGYSRGTKIVISVPLEGDKMEKPEVI
ncbi:sensor histidine kinase [Runella salmonicolor]|uniref:histidine kinase n=1 Tax=Runella salmonicolor TaxID=2950278 RepID=A0ABT1FIP4_9BACT|nr:ATP-binding protein [Runella salmonicolor]MCP1381380.1 histidine kinase [Runella salmonicolor]